MLVSTLNTAPPPRAGGPLAPLPADQRTEKLPPAVPARAWMRSAQGWWTTPRGTSRPPECHLRSAGGPAGHLPTDAAEV